MHTTTNDMIFWSILKSEDWSIHIAAIEQGLCFVGGNSAPFDEMELWSKNTFPSPEFVRDDRKLETFSNELLAYLQGNLKSFSQPKWYKGTAFQEAVWQALDSIPYGQTYSYSQIAQAIGKPAAVRAVGAAIGANPLLIMIPCHRVIGKNGSLTGYRGGIEMKTKLLQLEKQLN